MLDILLKRQSEMEMTQEQFAKYLGIPRTTWTRTASGKYPIGHRVAIAVLRRMPELTPEVTMYLRDHVEAQDVSVSTAPDGSTISEEDHTRTPATTARAS